MIFSKLMDNFDNDQLLCKLTSSEPYRVVCRDQVVCRSLAVTIGLIAKIFHLESVGYVANGRTLDYGNTSSLVLS